MSDHFFASLNYTSNVPVTAVYGPVGVPQIQCPCGKTTSLEGGRQYCPYCGQKPVNVDDVGFTQAFLQLCTRWGCDASIVGRQMKDPERGSTFEGGPKFLDGIVLVRRGPDLVFALAVAGAINNFRGPEQCRVDPNRLQTYSAQMRIFCDELGHSDADVYLELAVR